MPRVTFVIVPQPVGPPAIEQAEVESAKNKLGLNDTVEEVIEATIKVMDFMYPKPKEV